jgi:ArsR family transcriptional regulator, lead/cadmium/zinc/bismuth-responsive transcriptional repressor
MLDGELVCEALGAIGESGDIAAWAQRFKILADPSRLILLLCIHRAGPISVTDLAVAADRNDTTVSQALRLLRAGGTVAAKRDGRVVRCELADELTGGLLDRILGHRTPGHHGATPAIKPPVPAFRADGTA